MSADPHVDAQHSGRKKKKKRKKKSTVTAWVAVLGLALSVFNTAYQFWSAHQDIEEKQPIFRLGAVADDSGRPLKIVIGYDGQVRAAPTVQSSANVLMGTSSTELTSDDVLAQLCRCRSTILVPFKYWDRARPSPDGFLLQPARGVPSLSDLASAWTRAMGTQAAAVGLVTHVVIHYVDVRGHDQQVAYRVSGLSGGGTEAELPKALELLSGKGKRILTATSEPVAIAERCETPTENTALLASFDKTILPSLPGRLRNVFEAIRDGPENAARLQSCA